jgi:3-oxoacyl-[acyl-carrier protein] reductase
MSSLSFSFNDRVVLVTASSKGIGFGVAKRMLESRARVALCARDPEHLDHAQQELTEIADAARVFAMAGDIGDAAFLEALVRGTEKHFKSPISILVNNNGGPPPTDALLATDEQWHRAFDVNFFATVRLCRLVVPGMREQRYGRIVNLTSTTAKEPDPGMVLSNVTRAAVSSFAKTLAREVGPSGITVNTVLTGGCLTDRLKNLIARDIEGTGETLEHAIARAGSTMPVGFIPTPDELANFVLFLASEEAGYLTGTSIPYDGGFTKGML